MNSSLGTAELNSTGGTTRRRLRVIALMAAGILGMIVAGAGWKFFQARQVSEPARVAIAELRTLADRLESADRKGDRALALQDMDPLATLLRRLNDTPGIEAKPLQNCRLAAVHLAEGVGDVYKGGSWGNKSQFKAALAECT